MPSFSVAYCSILDTVRASDFNLQHVDFCGGGILPHRAVDGIFDLCGLGGQKKPSRSEELPRKSAQPLSLQVPRASEYPYPRSARSVVMRFWKISFFPCFHVAFSLRIRGIARISLSAHARQCRFVLPVRGMLSPRRRIPARCRTVPRELSPRNPRYKLFWVKPCPPFSFPLAIRSNYAIAACYCFCLFAVCVPRSETLVS